MPNQSPKKNKRKRKKSHDYLKYSGMAFEMAIIMALFTFGGSKLDGFFETEKNYFTILGALLGTGISLVYTLRDFIKNDK